MKAIILAAGLGSRISGLTSGRPKCLIELYGKSILQHQLDLLAGCGITQVTIITGFEADQIRSHVNGAATCVYYPFFASTNNLHTLHYYRQLLTGEMLLLFADVLIARDALQECIRHEGDFVLLVDRSRCLEGTMRVRVSGNSVADIGPHIPVADGDGNFVGITCLSEHGSVLLADELNKIASGSRNAYYTEALRSLAGKGHRLDFIDLRGRPWLEVDTEEDYRIALTKGAF